jgi:glycerate 2-kinase
LAGGLAALGGRLVPGFELIAEAVDLRTQIDEADLVITGEGFLDEQSFHGKVVGCVVAAAREAGVRVAVICGDVDPELNRTRLVDLEVVSLVEQFGEQASWNEPRRCVEAATRQLLSA